MTPLLPISAEHSLSPLCNFFFLSFSLPQLQFLLDRAVRSIIGGHFHRFITPDLFKGMHFSFDFVGFLVVFKEELGGGAILLMAETLRSDLRRSDRRMFGVFIYVGRF